MDFNRNQFFFIGLVVLLLGLQFHYVSSYVLTPKATQFLADRTGHATPAAIPFYDATFGSYAAPRTVLEPPEWMGWLMISVGAVLVLHSLAMPKPG